MKVKKGIYRHFKNKDYLVLGSASHSETLEEFVVYQPLYKSNHKNDFWIRPLSNFIEEIEMDGKKVPRFRYLRAK